MEQKAMLCGEEVLVREIVDSALWSAVQDLPWAKTPVPMLGGGMEKVTIPQAQNMWALMHGVVMEDGEPLSIQEAHYIIKIGDPKGAARIGSLLTEMLLGTNEELDAEKKDGENGEPDTGHSSSESAESPSTAIQPNSPSEG